MGAYFWVKTIILLCRTIGNPSETHKPDWRPIGDLDMLHRIPIETNMPYGRQTSLFEDPLGTDMLGWRPTFLIRDQHV